jgi:hypothetical protein
VQPNISSQHTAPIGFAGPHQQTGIRSYHRMPVFSLPDQWFLMNPSGIVSF